MRRSNWTPSIVPKSDDQNVCLVLDDLGRLGQVWREADAETTDLETVIADLLDRAYKDPVRVVSFSTAEKWSQDVSAGRGPGVAAALRSHQGRYHDIQLRTDQAKRVRYWCISRGTPGHRISGGGVH